MSIRIGNHNKISNSIISENSSVDKNEPNKNFFQKHPILSGIFITVFAGFILMFSFWDKIKVFIEGLFCGK